MPLALGTGSPSRLVLALWITRDRRRRDQYGVGVLFWRSGRFFLLSYHLRANTILGVVVHALLASVGRLPRIPL